MGFYTNPSSAGSAGANGPDFRIMTYTTQSSLGQQAWSGLFVSTYAQTITKLRTYCPAVQSGSVIQLGIYDSAGNLLSSGTVTTTAATGFYTVTLGTAVNLALSGIYYLAALNQTNETVTRFAAIGSANDNNVTSLANGTTTLAATRPTGAASAIAIYINPLS